MDTPERDEKGRLLPGNTANPNGRPPLSQELKDARKFTKERYEEALHRIMAMSMDDLKDFMKNKQGDVMETAMCAILLKCISRGDITPFETFTQRMIGRVPNKPLNVNLTAGSIAELMLKIGTGTEEDSDVREQDDADQSSGQG